MRETVVRVLCAGAFVQVSGIAFGLGPGDLLDRYTANADRAVSWRLRCSSVQESLMDGDPNGLDRGYRISDIRSDGERVFWSWLQWGGLVATADFLPQEKATYHSFVWDGRSFSAYAAKGKNREEGVLHLEPDPDPRQVDSMQCLNAVAPLFGYYPNAYARVDQIVREAYTASLREETESVNGADCPVLEARTDHGHYTLWIDPERGYNIVKADIHAAKEEEQQYLGRLMQTARWHFQIEIPHFQEYDGVWVATEGTVEESHELPQGDSYTTKSHIKITELVLNPDHEVLRSFQRDDIADGAWGWTAPYSHIKCVWQQGNFVPIFNEKAVAQIDRTVKILQMEQLGLCRTPVMARTLSEVPNAASEPDQMSVVQTESERVLAEAGGDGSVQEREQTETNESQGSPYPHCGLYCIYTMIGVLGREADFRELIKPEYLASSEGSSLLELRRAALDLGIYAETVGGLTTRGLEHCSYPAILHVRSHAASPKYDHYELFLGMEKGKVWLYSPPAAPRLVEFKDLVPRWDGRALFLCNSPIDTAAILSVDRQRWLLYGMIGVLVLLIMHAGSRLWLSVIGRLPGSWALGLSAGQAAFLGLAALLCAGFYHFTYDEGLLANATATEALQEGHALDFIPRLSARKTHKLLGTETIFVDARLAGDYERGHLDDAISLPIDANDAVWEATIASIPRRARIVTYCQSPGCQFAEKVSLRLKEEGYRDVAIFKGGWVEWTARYGHLESPSQPL